VNNVGVSPIKLLNFAMYCNQAVSSGCCYY